MRRVNQRRIDVVICFSMFLAFLWFFAGLILPNESVGEAAAYVVVNIWLAVAVVLLGARK